MPFKKRADIKIINYSDTDVSVESGDIGVSDWNWTDRTMYFHCDWRGENGMDTDRPFDWNYLTVQGKGAYVGDTLALFNRALLPHPNGTGTWWGEGDEKIVVDMETFPSNFGTGTEDYYGYSWGVGGTFSAPFHLSPEQAPDSVSFLPVLKDPTVRSRETLVTRGTRADAFRLSRSSLQPFNR